MTELAIARGDGRYAKQLARVAKIDLLVSDDWGMPPGMKNRMRESRSFGSVRSEGRGTLIYSENRPVADGFLRPISRVTNIETRQRR